MSGAACPDDPTVTVELTWGDAGSLELPPDCPDDGSGLWWNLLSLPAWAYRYSYAPPSAWVPGNVLLAATADSSALTVSVAAQGSSLANLLAVQHSLEYALAHFDLVVTVTADTVTLGSWEADPTMPQWGAVTPQRLGLLVAETALSIPVQPVGAP